MELNYLSCIQQNSNKRGSIQRDISRWILRENPRIKTVIDFGAGRCEFSNQLNGLEVSAIDLDPQFIQFAAPEVSCKVGGIECLSSIQSNSIDLFYASNVLEHLEKSEGERLLSEAKRILRKQSGRLILIQPNFKYSYKRYFDDLTHKTIYTETSLQTLLEISGFVVIRRHPRFLPYSLQSRLRFLSFLAPIYLMLPVKWLKGQMFFEVQLPSVLDEDQ